MNKKNITQCNSLDLFKFLMAICVIALHTHPLYNYKNSVVYNLYDVFTKCAVPFFFMTSGYLLALKLHWPYNSEQDIKTIKIYLYKLTKWYIVWNIIYLPPAIYYYYKSGRDVIYCIFLYLKGFFLLGSQYNSWMLWYLLSCIYSLLIFVFLLKRHISPKSFWILGTIFMCFSFCINFIVDSKNNFFQINKLIDLTLENGRMLQGTFYFSIGMIWDNKKINKKLKAMILCCGMIIAVRSVGIVREIGICICSVGLFAMVEDIKLKNAGIYSVLRKISTVMYFLHMYIWMIYYRTVYGQKKYGMDSFLVTCSVCCFVAIICIWLREMYEKFFSRTNL